MGIKIRIVCEVNNTPCIYNGETFTTDMSAIEYIFDEVKHAKQAIEDAIINEPEVNYTDFNIIIEVNDNEPKIFPYKIGGIYGSSNEEAQPCRWCGDYTVQYNMLCDVNMSIWDGKCSACECEYNAMVDEM